MDALALYHTLLMYKDSATFAAIEERLRARRAEDEASHRERVRRKLAAVEERIRTRRAENEARHRERLRRVAAAAQALDP